MKYPTLGASRMAELASVRLETGACDLGEAISWAGDGDPVDEGPLESLAERIHARLEEFERSGDRSDRDLLEGQLAAELHRAFRSVPLLALDDPGFWRYLTLRYFWEFVVWRESAAFETRDYSKYRKYVDGTNPSECVAMRMYLRAQIALEEDGSYDLAWSVPKGTDFWRSHILRVRTSSSFVVSRAFVREQAERRMATSELREFARRLNRIRTNVVLNVYDTEEASALLSELREAVPVGTEAEESA